MPITNMLRSLLFALIALFPFSNIARAGDGLKILLLGDSTCIGSICRKIDPRGPHLEDVIRLLLAAEHDLPPTEVVNQGRDGELIHRLLDSGRFDREIATIKNVDYILIRYGINDAAKRDDFKHRFPEDYAELIGRLRTLFPTATIVPTSIMPGMTRDDDGINAMIRKVADAEGLPYLDIAT
ncbi:MAG: SGNH/GDSL hydrolase family protein, partial [Isosphaeraceae bacterium]